MKNDRLTLSRLGKFKVKLHQEVMDKVKTCTVKREGLGWYVVFSVEYEFEPPPAHNGQPVGIDVGLEHLVNLSSGKQVDNPRFFRKSKKHLTKVQRKLARLKHLLRRDPTKIKAKRSVTRAYARVKH